MHGPPRYGKSIIVGQRLIPWLLMHNPAWRCPLMTYNIDHSSEFGVVIRDLMRQDTYKTWAGRMAWLEREDCSAKAFRTISRARAADGDMSFRALGFQTGFTGKGADCLIMDDPYASVQDANSEAVNSSTLATYRNQIKLRVGYDAPLIAMYHRYHEHDLGGALLEEGGWKHLRFPCIADSRDNADGSDITNRKDGELLSDLWPEEHIFGIRDSDPMVFASMYQGRPRPPEGGFIKLEDLRTGPVPHLEFLVRYWDLATTTKKTGDWTVGALGGVGPGQQFYLKDIERFRMEWPDACARIAEITESEAYEAKRKGIRYAVGVDARSTQLGFFQQLMRQRIFDPNGEGLTVQLWPDKSKGDKKERAAGWVADARHGRFTMAVGPWNPTFISECLAFTGEDIDTDDQVDAVSGLHGLVWMLSGKLHESKQKPQPGTNAWIDKLLKKRKT